MTLLALRFSLNLALVLAGVAIGIFAVRLILHPRKVLANTRLFADQLWSMVLTETESRRAGILRAGGIARRHARAGVVYEDRDALDKIEPYQVVIRAGDA